MHRKGADKKSDEDDEDYVEEIEEDTWFESKAQLHVHKAMQIKVLIVILIGNVMNMKRTVLNDLLQILM